MAVVQTSPTLLGNISINPQGEYSSGTAYERLDVVTSNGSGYICIQDCQNVPVTNTSYWYLLVSKGDTYEVTEEDLQRIATQIEEDASSLFNQLVAQKTLEFNTNSTQKTQDFNTNATQKTSDFDSNATSKTTEFNNNASSKTSDFNTNATQKGVSFDANYDDKLGLFNGNATTKTNDYNDNASSKTTTFNNNATDKTEAFDGNAEDKTDDFNDNYTAKLASFNSNAESYDAHIRALEDNFDTDTTPNSNDFTLTDSASGFNKGNIKIGETEITQITTSISEGDEYDSPSPDHPQNINVVEGESEVDTSNKNLFDKTKVTTGYINYSTGVFSSYEKYKTTDYIVVKEGETYYSNYESYPSSTTGVSYFDKNKDFISGTALPSSHKLVPPANSKYMRITVRIEPISTETTGLTNIDEMYVVKGTTPTEYVPHKGKSFPITLPQGMFLGKIGDSSNYIYGTKDNWKLHSGLAIFDDMSSLSSNGMTDEKIDLITPTLNIEANLPSGESFRCNTLAHRVTNNSGIGGTNGASRIRISLSKEYASSYSEAKTFLANKNTKIYYPLATSTETNITDTTLIPQLNNMIDNLQTYKGGTIVFTTSENLEPAIQFDYMVNPFASIESEMSDMKNAILSLGGEV